MDRRCPFQKELEMLKMLPHPTSDLKITVLMVLKNVLCLCGPPDALRRPNLSIQPSQAGSYLSTLFR